MTESEKVDIIGTPLARSVEAGAILGAVVSPVAERLGETATIFLSRKFRDLRRSLRPN